MAGNASSHWSAWAQRALDRMQECSVVDADAWGALQHTLRTGQEPYYTLKAFVALELENAGEPEAKKNRAPCDRMTVHWDEQQGIDGGDTCNRCGHKARDHN